MKKLGTVAVVVLMVALFLLAAYVGGQKGQASYDRAHQEWEQTVIDNRN